METFPLMKSFINVPRHSQSICQFIDLLRPESPHPTCGPASVFQAQSYFPRSVCQAVQVQRRTAKTSGPGEVSRSLFGFSSLSAEGIISHVPLNSSSISCQRLSPDVQQPRLCSCFFPVTVYMFLRLLNSLC